MNVLSVPGLENSSLEIIEGLWGPGLGGPDPDTVPCPQISPVLKTQAHLGQPNTNLVGVLFYQLCKFGLFFILLLFCIRQFTTSIKQCRNWKYQLSDKKTTIFKKKNTTPSHAAVLPHDSRKSILEALQHISEKQMKDYVKIKGKRKNLLQY